MYFWGEYPRDFAASANVFVSTLIMDAIWFTP